VVERKVGSKKIPAESSASAEIATLVPFTSRLQGNYRRSASSFLIFSTVNIVCTVYYYEKPE
jgi:hypothetical protein